MTELDSVFELLEERAAVEPKLNRYRVEAGGPGALGHLPDGWFVSDAVQRIAVDGGWWPGRWTLSNPSPIEDADDLVRQIVLAGAGRIEGANRSVQWAELGTVYEADHFWTPLLSERAPTAPPLGWSADALWTSMAFPTEAALLSAFVVAFDELGFDEDPEMPLGPSWLSEFVLWPVQPPMVGVSSEAELRTFNRIQQAARTWESSHRCWLTTRMPFQSSEILEPDVIATLLGVEPRNIVR